MALDLTDNPATNAAGEVLGKKYGPLPLYAWLGIVTVTILGVRHFQGKKSDQVAATDNPTNASAGSGLRMPLPASDSTFGGGSLTTGGTGAPTPSFKPDTNQDWLNRALNSLGGTGKYDPYAIQMALQTYISGYNITDPTQRAIVSDALAAVGGPPSAPGGDANTGGGTPLGGDATVARFIKPADSSAIYAQYTDGTIRWIQSSAEMEQIANSNPAAFRTDAGGWNYDVLPQQDPIFQRAILGVSQSEFDKANAQGRAASKPGTYSNAYHNR